MEDKKESVSVEKLELRRQEYLKKFKKEVHPKEGMFEEDKTNVIGEEIVNILKKEELTYVDSYAALEYAYRLLKFNSEFTHL